MKKEKYIFCMLAICMASIGFYLCQDSIDSKGMVGILFLLWGNNISQKKH